jgi:hypothetical protein
VVLRFEFQTGTVRIRTWRWKRPRLTAPDTEMARDVSRAISFNDVSLLLVMVFCVVTDEGYQISAVRRPDP